MKKLLSIAAISALLVTGANAIENEIVVQGEVQAGAVVSIGDYMGTELVGGTMVLEGTTIDLDSMPLGGDTPISLPISVRTNSTSGVKMTLTDTVNSGFLVDGDKEPIKMAYQAKGSDVELGASFELVNGTDDGTVSVGDFIATATVPSAQESGVYSTTLTALVEAI